MRSCCVWADKYTVKLKNVPKEWIRCVFNPEQVDFLIEQISFIMTVRIGITGIGSGKSVVSRLLKWWGYLSIPIWKPNNLWWRIIASAASWSLCWWGGMSVEYWIKLLLASYLFGSPEHARQVNGIVHPRVKEDFRQWVRQHAGCSMAGINLAILIEAGLQVR